MINKMYNKILNYKLHTLFGIYIKRTYLKKYCSTTNNELAASYVPHILEENHQITDYFKPPLKSTETFSILLPPPNITGTLHLGHALTVTIQDILVRWKRMKGIETSWIPGIDHAGIATQVVVEKKLWKEKHRTRHELGRELFTEKIWNWKREKASTIDKQLHQLQATLDWSNKLFTMDLKQSEAVIEAFIRLFDHGLIYRSDYLVNWSCVLQSAISDIEVEHLSISGPTDLPVPGYSHPVRFGVLTKFAYKVHKSSSGEEIVVATTRPETMLGDVAVAVNPNDARYQSFIGLNVWHPFRNETIPVIADDFVNSEFGTGAVKITPAHDQTDFAVSKRHNLNILSVIDETGNFNAACGEFAGLPRFDARSVIINKLEKLKLLRGHQDHPMTVPFCSRSQDVIEFLIKPQWFLKCHDMAQSIIADVKNGALSIDPDRFENNLISWLQNMRDWCISRQLWWGHRIPVYLCCVQNEPNQRCWVAAKNMESALEKAAIKLSVPKDVIIIQQDEDVLDTWFSSSLLPFSAHNWPQKINKFYPLSLMETGHDILYFWVVRMAMLGKHLTGQLPFPKILLHGVVCDANGRKMSKSLGNVIIPEDIISGIMLQDLEENSRKSYETGALSEDELKRATDGQKKMFPNGIQACGVDALRFTLCSHNIKAHFISFDVNECYSNKLFCNKIWQATKFTKKWTEKVSEAQQLKEISFKNLQKMDKWILSRLSGMVTTVDNAINNYDFHIATTALKKFLYYDFCDVYLETTKRELQNVTSFNAARHCLTLVQSLDVSLRALAPFMPILTQHLHQHLPQCVALSGEISFPTSLKWKNEELENEIDIILETALTIRRLKKIFNMSLKQKTSVNIASKLSIYSELHNTIEDLAGCDIARVDNEFINRNEETVVAKVGNYATLCLVIPASLKKSLNLDQDKLQKKETKLFKELEKFKSMVSAESYKINASTTVQELHLKKIMSLEEELSRIDYMKVLLR